MKDLIQKIKQAFRRKGDVVVYRNGKAYRFKTFSEAYNYISNEKKGRTNGENTKRTKSRDWTIADRVW